MWQWNDRDASPQTLCFFQASLNDLALRRDTQSFGICSRVLQAVTHIIFSDPSTQRRSGSQTLLPIIPRRKVKPNVQPALVGLGTILASCPGLPMLAQVVGDAAVEQGRYADPRILNTGPMNSEDAGISQNSFKDEAPSRLDAASELSDDELTDQEQSDAEQDVEAYGRSLIAARDAAVKSGLTPLIEPPSPSVARRNTIGPSASPRHLDKPERPNTHRRSSSSRPTPSPPSLSHRPSLDIMAFHSQTTEYQSRLLRSHYLHSEVQFLQTLSAIS